MLDVTAVTVVSSAACTVTERTSCETPTLLHLAAKYELRQLCYRLLDLPDSAHACRLSNVHGRRPAQLAAANRLDDLASRLTPQNVGA